MNMLAALRTSRSFAAGGRVRPLRDHHPLRHVSGGSGRSRWDWGKNVRELGTSVVALLVAASTATALMPAAGAGGGPRKEPGRFEPVTPPRRADRGPLFVPGEVVVRYRSRATAASRAAARRLAGAERRRGLGRDDLEVLRLAPGASVADAVQALEADPAVRYSEPHYLYRAARTIPDDAYFPEQWGLDNTRQFGGSNDADIDAPEAWDTTTGDPAVLVAVVDTGVDLDHPELADSIWSNPAEDADGVDDDANGLTDDVRGWDFVDGDADPSDEEGHGTHVAGIVGAQGGNAYGTTGVAWDVTIMPLRVLGPDGGTSTEIAQAFQYAADHGAKIVNASLGGPGFSQMLFESISANPQTLFIVAAGNGEPDAIGDDNDRFPTYPCSYTAANLICVAATDEADQITSFSNFGKASVDLAAPGQDIESTWPQLPVARTGAFALADSPDLNYAAGTGTGSDGSWVQPANPIDLTGQTGCRLNYFLRMATELGFDGLVVETSTDGTTWTVLESWSGSTDDAYDQQNPSISVLDGSATARFRFRLLADQTNNYDGAYIDDVTVTCTSSGTTPLFSDGFEADITSTWTAGGTGISWGRSGVTGQFNYLHGTSMATPAVAGAAVLVWTLDPGATATRVRDVLLGSVDIRSSLKGKMTTKGRLNAASAVRCAPDTAPPTGVEIAGGDTARDFQRSDVFDVAWTGTDAPCGIATYDVRYAEARYDDSELTDLAPLLTKTTKTSVAVDGAPGFTFCFTARARDKALNLSAFGEEVCTAVPTNDRQMDASSAWDRKRGSGYYLGTYSEAKREGATLRLRDVFARRIVLVATTCDGCGKVGVYRGSTLLRRISLDGGSTDRKRFFDVVAFPDVTSLASVKVKVLSSGKPVRIEGLGISLV